MSKPSIIAMLSLGSISQLLSLNCESLLNLKEQSERGIRKRCSAVNSLTTREEEEACMFD